MKRIITKILSAGLIVSMLAGCIKDKGNYTYDYGNSVTIRYATYSYNAFLKDTIKVYPMRTWSNPNDTTEFEHAWFINGKQVSDEPILKYVGEELGQFSAYYYMKDKRSGIQFPAASQVNLNVTSPYGAGWGLLYEKDGESELAHVRIAGTSYFDYTGLYKSFNDGESMGSEPVKIRDYYVTGGRGMYVLQNGGQGPIELDANTLKKKLVAKNVFTQGPPADLKPVDIGFFPTTDFMVNHDGNVYARVLPQNALPYAIPWVSTPLYITGGLKVGDIWDVWTTMSGWGIMYEKTGNRLLRIRTYVPNMGNPAIAIDTFPVPEIPYPANYCSLQRMGNWQYVWGGSFNDGWNFMDGALILRSPDDNNLYWQTFEFNSDGVYPKITPGTRIPFQGNSVVTAQSKFTAVKPRDYLFFTGGSNNDELWYYDARTGAPVVKYVTTPSKINVITAHDNGNSIGVGLEDGTFIVYDISNQVIVDGVSKELHRLSGLGRVVDVIVKGGYTN